MLTPRTDQKPFFGRKERFQGRKRLKYRQQSAGKTSMEKREPELGYKERAGFSHTEKERRHCRQRWEWSNGRERRRGLGSRRHCDLYAHLHPAVSCWTQQVLHKPPCTSLLTMLPAHTFHLPVNPLQTLQPSKRHPKLIYILFLCKLPVITYSVQTSLQVFLLSWKYFESQLRFLFLILKKVLPVVYRQYYYLNHNKSTFFF